ncbi:uncharacterized protein RCC_00019 [Ramularia collo-cygni]|uniref:2EXR domain-containing protein n=1 Tax=Ramularia collo-cygni TaxID=112498 RepID=A0A2D3UVM5_9PEZI|nr:uncharacterized protein RCC_00019 [Ramularia collo-cygni]CZT14044.1 uncharacterized protein RCC_00019 [Ramularia collo-cygni]
MEKPQGMNVLQCSPHSSTGDIRDALIARMRAHTARQLEQEYPWMAKPAVKELSDEVASCFEKGIIAHESVIALAKPRMSFLKLPTELRNIVYGMALNDHSDDGHGQVVLQRIIIARNEDKDDFESQTAAGTFTHTPALLMVSREIRSEVEPFYYGSSTFMVEVSADIVADKAQSWLEHVGSYGRSMIRNLIINFINLDRVGLISLLSDSAHSHKFCECLRIHDEFLTRESSPSYLDISMPQKLRRSVSWIKERIQIDTTGVAETAITVQFSSTFDETASLSPTELFCAFCYRSGEPDNDRFRNGVCNGCEISRVENGMCVGPWAVKPRHSRSKFGS